VQASGNLFPAYQKRGVGRALITRCWVAAEL
jgi:hypothetical protein